MTCGNPMVHHFARKVGRILVLRKMLTAAREDESAPTNPVAA